MKCDVYFSRLYRSQELGANENMNGLIQRYFPKGGDFDQVTGGDCLVGTQIEHAAKDASRLQSSVL